LAGGRTKNLLLLHCCSCKLFYVPAFYDRCNLVVVSGGGCLPGCILTREDWFLSDLSVSTFYRLHVSGVRHYSRPASDSSRALPHRIHAQSTFPDIDSVYAVRVSSLHGDRDARRRPAPKRSTRTIHLRNILYRSFVLDLSQHAVLSVRLVSSIIRRVSCA
jgi:hypothetical protein